MSKSNISSLTYQSPPIYIYWQPLNEHVNIVNVHRQNGWPDKESYSGFSSSTGSATPPHMNQLLISLASFSALDARSSFSQ